MAHKLFSEIPYFFAKDTCVSPEAWAALIIGIWMAVSFAK